MLAKLHPCEQRRLASSVRNATYRSTCVLRRQRGSARTVPDDADACVQLGITVADLVVVVFVVVEKVIPTDSHETRAAAVGGVCDLFCGGHAHSIPQKD